MQGIVRTNSDVICEQSPIRFNYHGITTVMEKLAKPFPSISIADHDPIYK